MAVMAAERKQARRWEEVPPPPPAPDSYSIQRLREMWDAMDESRYRVEIIGGELIVSMMTPVIWHEMTCRWLVRSLDGACAANNWFPDTFGAVDLPPTGDRVIPDLMILRDASTLPKFESLRPLDRVLLVAEVVSPSSVQRDRTVKPRACALAGIPLYLLVDRFTRPLTVSLHSEPGKDGYAKVITAIAGEKLQLPAPFDLELDTSALPLPE